MATQFYRYLGWRPIGSNPMFAPDYVRRYRIRFRPEAEQSSSFDWDAYTGTLPTDWMMEDGYVSPLFRDAFVSATCEARYDGFYLLDIEIDQARLVKLSPLFKGAGAQPNGQTPPDLDQTMQEAANQLAMFVKFKLGHRHYFHMPVGRQVRRISAYILNAPAWVYLLITVVSAFLLWGLALPQFRMIGGIWRLGYTGLSISMLLTSAALFLFSPLRLFDPDRLNTNLRLATGPTRIAMDSDEPVPFCSKFSCPHWIGGLKTVPTKDTQPLHQRPALGQLRRDFLRIQEKVDEQLNNFRMQEVRLTRWFSAVFWLTAVTLFAALSLTLPLPFNEFPFSAGPGGDARSPRLMTLIVLWGTVAFLLITLVMILIAISVFDLPRVKLLRASQGFFTAANPINRSIEAIEHQRRLEPVARFRRANAKQEHPSTVHDFSAVIDAFEVKVGGESQRLQNKQFLSAIVVAMIGASMTAIAILLPGVESKAPVAASSENLLPSSDASGVRFTDDPPGSPTEETSNEGKSLNRPATRASLKPRRSPVQTPPESLVGQEATESFRKRNSMDGSEPVMPSDSSSGTQNGQTAAPAVPDDLEFSLPTSDGEQCKCPAGATKAAGTSTEPLSEPESGAATPPPQSSKQ